MIARLAPLALPLLLACNSDKDDEGAGEEARNSYFDALCRIYVEPACVEAQSAECGASLSFDTEEDCQSFLSFALGSCDAAERWIGENADLVADCSAELDAIECGTDPLCDENGDPATASGACAQVDAQLTTLCESDTGF